MNPADQGTWSIFSLFGRRKPDVIEHWYALLPNFQASAQEFYGSIEQELKARQVPGLEMSRVEFAEGGLLSAKREYLRMCRERLVFDVCAAPFGTAYFFSCRFAEIPPVIKLWELLVAFFGFCVTYYIFYRVFGFFFGSVLLLVALCGLVYLLRNAIAMGLRDLDATLIKIPVIGPIYEVFFRKETYYRQDTRLMYLETVSTVVRELVEEVAAAKGVRMLQISQYSPVMSELYKPTTVSLPEPQPAKIAGES